MNAIVENTPANAVPLEVATIGVPPSLSFVFARRHGVVLQEIAADRAIIISRPDVTPFALAEVRRFVGLPLELRRVSEEEFERELRNKYEGGDNVAMQAMGGLEEDTDLAHLALDLPEPSDLLESDDDAP